MGKGTREGEGKGRETGLGGSVCPPVFLFLSSPATPPQPLPLLPPVCIARSAAVGQLVEAVAHEVYRQISNRYSLNAGFQPPELLRVLQAYAQLQYEDSECATGHRV